MRVAQQSKKYTNCKQNNFFLYLSQFRFECIADSQHSNVLQYYNQSIQTANRFKHARARPHSKHTSGVYILSSCTLGKSKKAGAPVNYELNCFVYKLLDHLFFLSTENKEEEEEKKPNIKGVIQFKQSVLFFYYNFSWHHQKLHKCFCHVHVQHKM